LRSTLIAICVVVAACDESSGASGAIDAPVAFDAPTVADATALDASATDGGVEHAIPDPGTGPMSASWPDTEPNDTPEQAVPLGVGRGQIGPYVGGLAGSGHLGDGDAADYFVFRTSADLDTTFIASACWDSTLNVNLLDIFLYRVVDGKTLVPIASSTDTGTACDRLMPFNIPLEPNSEYLLGLVGVEGEATYQA